MNTPNLAQLLGVVAKTEIPAHVAHGGGGTGKMSFGIVNSGKNGKRLTFSKLLAQKVGLTDRAYLALAPSENYVLIACKAISENAIECKFSNAEESEKKISYNASAVYAITDMFGLNFQKHVSVSYDDVTIDKLDDGTLVAIVKVYNKHPDAE